MASLMLYPSLAGWTDESQVLEPCLQQTGLIGEKLPDQFGEGFLVGDSFISLINFMGCAPAISFSFEDASTVDEFCAVRLHQYQSPKFLHAERLPVPRCPLCRARFQSVISIDDHTAEIQCEACEKSQPIHSLVWKQAAGYASTFIEVTSIYPQEAHPVQSLMNALADTSQCEWRYFYK